MQLIDITEFDKTTQEVWGLLAMQVATPKLKDQMNAKLLEDVREVFCPGLKPLEAYNKGLKLVQTSGVLNCAWLDAPQKKAIAIIADQEAALKKGSPADTGAAMILTLESGRVLKLNWHMTHATVVLAQWLQDSKNWRPMQQDFQKLLDLLSWKPFPDYIGYSRGPSHTNMTAEETYRWYQVASEAYKRDHQPKPSTPQEPMFAPVAKDREAWWYMAVLRVGAESDREEAFKVLQEEAIAVLKTPGEPREVFEKALTLMRLASVLYGTPTKDAVRELSSAKVMLRTMDEAGRDSFLLHVRQKGAPKAFLDKPVELTRNRVSLIKEGVGGWCDDCKSRRLLVIKAVLCWRNFPGEDISYHPTHSIEAWYKEISKVRELGNLIERSAKMVKSQEKPEPQSQSYSNLVALVEASLHIDRAVELWAYYEEQAHVIAQATGTDARAAFDRALALLSNCSALAQEHFSDAVLKYLLDPQDLMEACRTSPKGNVRLVYECPAGEERTILVNALELQLMSDRLKRGGVEVTDKGQVAHPNFRRILEILCFPASGPYPELSNPDCLWLWYCTIQNRENQYQSEQRLCTFKRYQGRLSMSLSGALSGIMGVPFPLPAPEQVKK